MFSALAMLMMASSAKAGGFDPYDRMGMDRDNGVTFMTYFGMNISNFRGLEPGWAMNPKAGFNLGIRGEYMLPECYGIFINGSLEYSMKGARDHVSDVLGVTGATAIARPMYLSLPVHVGYRYNLPHMVGVYADFGPYFAFGTNGKYLLKYDDYSEDVTKNFFRDSNNGFLEAQRFDFGLGFRVGAEYADHYNFILGMDWGITDMLTQDQKHILYTGGHDFKMKNFNASLTFGYRF